MYFFLFQAFADHVRHREGISRKHFTLSDAKSDLCDTNIEHIIRTLEVQVSVQLWRW